ncbi:MAG: hypothetical protein LW853_01325, partial [Rickettsiales bacterium]|nr:hypothetical protein [Rickettsiales bacterium]
MPHSHDRAHSTSIAPERRGAVYEGQARLMRLATYASISVAVALVALKAVAWWLSDSLAMLSSLTDSFFDVLTSLMNFIAL